MYAAGLKKVWTWFKRWWWAVLLPPVAILLWLWKLFTPAKLNSTLKAMKENDRLEKERAALEDTHMGELEAEIEEIEHQERIAAGGIAAAYKSEVEELREDPERLREAMMDAGPGEKP